jgi:hypothetical protein
MYCRGNPIKYSDPSGYSEEPKGWLERAVRKLVDFTGGDQRDVDKLFNSSTRPMAEGFTEPALKTLGVPTNNKEAASMAAFSLLGFARGVPIAVKGFTPHALQRMEERGLTEGIVRSALQNPQKVVDEVDELGRITNLVTTKRCKVVINENNWVVTVMTKIK